jgi:hypothetical protein
MTVSIWQRNSDSGSNQPAKKNSGMFGYIFKPRIGRNIGEIGRTFGIFPRLLANIFAMQGMFPRQHPALRDESIRLSLSDVLSVAYASLDWSRAGLPRVVFFFAVVFSIGFSVIALALAIMGIFSAPAHAAGIFTSPSPKTDLANMWLDHIFNGGTFSVTVPNAAGDLTSTTTTNINNTIPNLFRRLAGMYSNAMLVLAVIILLYHLINMTVMTAHEGKPMGRGAHQVWAPIRLVFALGLLVPVASGFSSGQYLVMWIAKQGSGLASYVWGNPTTGIGTTFVSQRSVTEAKPILDGSTVLPSFIDIGSCLKKNQIEMSSTQEPFSDPPPFPAVVTDVGYAGTLQALGGPGGPNAAVLAKGKTIRIDDQVAGETVNTAEISQKIYPVGWDFAKNTYRVSGGNVDCGSITYPASGNDPNAESGNPDVKVANVIRKAANDATKAVAYDAIQLGSINYLAQVVRQKNDDLTTPGLATFNFTDSKKKLEETYREAYINSIRQSALTTPGLTFNDDQGTVRFEQAPLSAADATKLASNPHLGVQGDLGWISAGAFYLKMAAQNGLIAGAVTYVPSVVASGSDDSNVQVQTKQEGTKKTDKDGGWPGGCWNPMNWISCAGSNFMALMGHVGLANDARQWIWHTQFTSAQPMSDMLNLGSKLINGAVMCIIMGAVLNILISAGDDLVTNALAKVLPIPGGSKNAVKAAKAATKIGKFAKFFGGPLSFLVSSAVEIVADQTMNAIRMLPTLLFSLGGLLFLPGILLFFILPTLPFLNFLTGIFTWFLSLMQAVIAIPIIAIAHITPNGEGLPSQSARGAYVMILQIFLRPIMMIFGLLAFIMVVNTGVSILNVLFFGVYKFQISSNSVNGLISGVCLFVLYAAAAYGIVNIANTAIDDFPLKAVSWIGGGSADRDHHVNSLAGIFLAQAAQGAISGFTNNINSATKGGAIGRSRAQADANASQAEQSDAIKKIAENTAKKKPGAPKLKPVSNPGGGSPQQLAPISAPGGNTAQPIIASAGGVASSGAANFLQQGATPSSYILGTTAALNSGAEPIGGAGDDDLTNNPSNSNPGVSTAAVNNLFAPEGVSDSPINLLGAVGADGRTQTAFATHGSPSVGLPDPGRVAGGIQNFSDSLPNPLARTVRVRRTGTRDGRGLERLSLQTFDGRGRLVYQAIVNSGAPNQQGRFGPPGATKDGSNAPLPFGRYTISDEVAGRGSGVGKVFVPLTPNFDARGRGDFGFHWDANRDVAPGSGGCVVFANLEEFNKFRNALRAAGANELIVDQAIDTTLGQAFPSGTTAMVATTGVNAEEGNASATIASSIGTNNLQGGTASEGTGNDDITTAQFDPFEGELRGALGAQDGDIIGIAPNGGDSRHRSSGAGSASASSSATQGSSGGLARKVRVQRTGTKDRHGLERLLLQTYDANGRLVYQTTVNSGVRSQQGRFGPGGATGPRSYAPLPFGRYRIGGEAPGDGTDGVGRVFIPLNPTFPTGGRGNFGFHWDANRAVKPGSAGCVVFETLADFNKFRDALRASGANELIVDQTMGQPLPGGATSTARGGGYVSSPAVIKAGWIKRSLQENPGSISAADAETSWNGIDAASRKTGISRMLLATTGMIESRGNFRLRPKRTNGYAGGFQIGYNYNKKTGKYEPDHPLSKGYIRYDQVYDPAAAAEATARSYEDFKKSYVKEIGREPPDSHLYLMHQQGEAGLLALVKNPDALASQTLKKYYGSEAAVRSMLKENAINPNATGREVVETWERKYNEQAKLLDPNYDPNASGAGGGGEPQIVEVDNTPLSIDFYGHAIESAALGAKMAKAGSFIAGNKAIW